MTTAPGSTALLLLAEEVAKAVANHEDGRPAKVLANHAADRRRAANVRISNLVVITLRGSAKRATTALFGTFLSVGFINRELARLAQSVHSSTQSPLAPRLAMTSPSEGRLSTPRRGRLKPTLKPNQQELLREWWQRRW